MSTTRRKRFERHPKPKKIQPADDHRLFQLMFWLLRLRFMETGQLARLLYEAGSLKYAERQLRALYDNGYIDRLPWAVDRRWGKTRAQFGAVRAIHCLDEKGAAFLADQLRRDRKDIDWRPRDNRKPGTMEHTLLLNDFLVDAHLAALNEGWTYEIMQTEREIHKAGGHERVTDPLSGKPVTVKADSVCRLVFTPRREGIYFSPELDMGTEGPKKIKAKVRAHIEHFIGGKYQKRHGVTSSRILFVVADVRDPLLPRPLTETEWRGRVIERCKAIKAWVEDVEPGPRRDLFWIAPSFVLDPERIYRGTVWLRAGLDGGHALVS